MGPTRARECVHACRSPNEVKKREEEEEKETLVLTFQSEDVRV